MDIIHLLPDSVANQIAAGEVIQRPASCLKELVENSLDAGAGNIQVILRDAGRTLLQVIDDGKGMSPTDARMAFERHATSKIQSASDLFNLHTMGFRGEALASIAAVAQVELQTCRAEDEVGTLIEIAGSQVVRQEFVQCAQGTSMKVKNLFFNVPARRRFLKTDATELRNIIQDFYRIVLVYPDIRFSLISDDEILFDLPAGSLKQRIEGVFGKSLKKGFAAQLVEMRVSTPMVRIFGYIGKPESAQKQAQQYFFVNGRYMRHPYFHKAVMSAYTGMLLPDYNPLYFIYFEISPDAIDVNIHPTKTEIKFADEASVWQILQAAVRESLGKFNLTPSLDFNREGDIDIPQAPPTGQSVEAPQVHLNAAYNPFTEQSHYRQTTGWEQLYAGNNTNRSSQYNGSIEDGERVFQEEKEEPLPIVDVEHVALWQYANAYIMLAGNDGLLMVDQHKAHISVLYEELLEQIVQHSAVRQQLLFPDTIDLTEDEATLMERLSDDLRYAGFDVTRLNRTGFSIDAVPALLGDKSPVAILQDIVHHAGSTGEEAGETLAQIIAASLAEAAAIERGRSLTEAEMRDLLKRLFSLKQYHYTPSGKAVIAYISDKELSSYFK